MENGYIQGFFLMVFLYGFSLLRFILSNGYLQILTIIALIAIFVVAYFFAFYIFAMYLLIKGYRVSKEKERGFYEN